MSQRLGHRAVVIGGSMTGLMTARVLSDHFEEVTVVERDAIDAAPVVHKSIPQGNHYHALLLGGQRVMESLYPGFTKRLRELGSARFRVGVEITWYGIEGKAYTPGGLKEARDLGFEAHSQSRGVIEHCVREFTLAIPNIRFESSTSVRELALDGGRVRGVRYSGGRADSAADLVVDAGGRGSRAPAWLRDLGFPEPKETSIGVDFAYTSTKFRIPDSWDGDEKLSIFFPGPPLTTGAIMGEIEGGVWHISLAGRFGDYPPGDEEGFMAFTKSLFSSEPYERIKDAERVADITRYRFPSSVQRHYERLESFPEGLLVIGDAICSFNPVYGQGMSAAALQVDALRELLASASSLDGLATAFFPKAAELIQTPWNLAASQDLVYEQTTGERPPDMEQRGLYMQALDALIVEDIEVQRLMTEVFHLAKPMSVLMEQPLLGRALAVQQRLSRASD